MGTAKLATQNSPGLAWWFPTSHRDTPSHHPFSSGFPFETIDNLGYPHLRKPEIGSLGGVHIYIYIAKIKMIRITVMITRIVMIINIVIE